MCGCNVSVHAASGRRKCRRKTFWGPDTFTAANVMVTQTPIPEPCVLQLHPSTGAVLTSWGARTFAMPHSITVDWQGNVWVADAGLHQVLKFSRKGERLWSAGVAWEPGSDGGHFCKPTDVAMLANGDVYISDGYCNHRAVVARFSQGAAAPASLLGVVMQHAPLQCSTSSVPL